MLHHLYQKLQQLQVFGERGGSDRELFRSWAGRFYQFLSGHASIGSYLHRVGRLTTTRAGGATPTGERQTRFHLVDCFCRAGEPR